jgi:hypothetical protein
MNRTLKTAVITVAAAAAAGALVALIIRGQISRHRRDLFSPRDFISWEPRNSLRERARAIVDRMMSEAGGLGIPAGPESA